MAAIRLATTCAQIEMAVRDVPAACRAFEELLGAVPIEQEVVKRITGVVLDIDHRWCGDAMFQFCSPLVDDVPARHELDRIGPCVTNLNFFVEDVEETVRLLTGAGATIRLRWRTSRGSWTRFLGEGNVRDTFADGYFLGTRHLFGFDFETTEPMWHDLARQHYFCPSFTEPSPLVTTGVDRLARLRVLVEDLDHYLGNLTTLIDARDRTGVTGHRTDANGRAARISLRGLELEYLEPAPDTSEHERLARRGAGIDTVVFAVADLDGRATHHMATTDVLGFDIQLVASP
jgi:hypothetical protein